MDIAVSPDSPRARRDRPIFPIDERLPAQSERADRAGGKSRRKFLPQQKLGDIAASPDSPRATLPKALTVLEPLEPNQVEKSLSDFGRRRSTATVA